MSMRRVIVAAIIVAAVTIVVTSFNFGVVAERRAQQQAVNAQESVSPTAAKQNRRPSKETDQSDHVLIANVATVSFGELWDVMRAAAPERRGAWADELEQMPPGTRRNAAIKSFYKIWGELDPAAAIEAIEKIPDKRIQGMAFVALAGAAADSALPAIAELEFRLGRRSSHFNLTSPLHKWSAADPQGVAHFLEARPDNDSGHFLSVSYGWANSDPEKAAEWFLNLRLPPLHNPKYPRQEDRRRLDAARGLLEAWVEKDSRGAAAFAATHAQDPNINKALGEFTGALFTKSHDEATAFILSLPDENSQRTALSEIANYIGSKPLILREGGDDEEPEEPEITAEDVPAWLVSLPRNVWIDRVGEIFRGWSQADSASAEAWLRSLPSDIKSKAIAHFTGTALPEQAQRVFELIALIEDANARRDALQNFVDSLSDNPTEMRQKIAALSVTDQQKQTLLRLVRKK
jgi:hypothetical protein